MSEFINKINYENDINLFIKSKIAKFAQPKLFEFVDYNPDIILRNRKGYSETSQHEISLKIFQKILKKFSNLKKILQIKKKRKIIILSMIAKMIYGMGTNLTKKNLILYLKSMHTDFDF